MTRHAMLAGALAILALALGCTEGTQSPGPKYAAAPATGSQPVYRFAVHPLFNPAKLNQAYGPLIDYLNAHLEGASLALEASRDYAAFEEKYTARGPEFLLPNPWQTLQAMGHGYAVIAQAGEPSDFRGIFIVRQDSGITEPADLKGRAVSYPSPTALAACIMPQSFLHARGIDINADIENRYVGSQESSILNVYMGMTAAGATWPPPWRAFQTDHPAEAAQLKVVWETDPLINNSVMVRDDVPADIREQVRRRLIRLHETEQGQAILATMETARFIPAADSDYETVRAYAARFEREVRKIR